MIRVVLIAAAFGLVNRAVERLKRRKRTRAPHTAASYVHHALAVPLAVRCVVTLPRPRLVSTSPASAALTTWSAGYFTYDVFASVGSPVYLFHAFAAGSVYWYGFHTQMLHHAAASHMLWELSTPFVHFREHLETTGRRETTLYKVNGVAMMIAFFLCRNVGGAFMLANARRQFLECPGAIRGPTWTVLKTAAVSMNALNAFWFSKMVRGAIKVFGGKKKARRLNPPSTCGSPPRSNERSSADTPSAGASGPRCPARSCEDSCPGGHGEGSPMTGTS